jgi:hypothetical protein
MDMGEYWPEGGRPSTFEYIEWFSRRASCEGSGEGAEERKV